MHSILFAATSERDYEMSRILVAEDWPEYGNLTVINGSHCSCYGFDDTTWYATVYDSREEIQNVMLAWRKNGYYSSSPEHHIGSVMCDHFGF